MYALSGLILLNVGFAMFIQDNNANGVPDMDKTWQLAYAVFECASTLVFTSEFLGRLWCCVEAPDGVQSSWHWLLGKRCSVLCGPVPTAAVNSSGGAIPAVVNSYAGRFACRVRWCTNPMSLLDLLVVFIFWADLMLEIYASEKVKGLGSVLRVFRLVQIALTVLKLESVSPGFRRVSRVLKARQSELLMCLFLAGAMTLLGAVIILFVEGSLGIHLPSGQINDFPECLSRDGDRVANPMQKRFSSLMRCIYWSSMTVTTVGYGDMHPCTALGQVVACVWGFFGVAVVALPSGIIGSGLVEVFRESELEASTAQQQLAQRKRLRNQSAQLSQPR